MGIKEDKMDAHFYFSLALIFFAFFLCFWFRKGNKKKTERPEESPGPLR